MNITYNELINEMKGKYFDCCGELPDDNSETAKRLEAVASELYSLSCYGDYIFKQAFIQTATGESLDLHAQLRGVTRKTADYSKGTLTFYVNEPASEDIVIPSGTVCSVSKKPYLQYATDSEAVISSGTVLACVSAAAIATGEEYNVNEGEITVMVNAPAGVSAVINDDCFCGGASDESDDSLRKRIINHYSMPPNGVNCQSVENVVLNLDFVTDCKISPAETAGVINAAVRVKDNELTSDKISLIQNAIGISELVGANVSVTLARQASFNIVVDAKIRAGFDKTKISEQITSSVNEICSALKIGEALMMNLISKKLVMIDGINTFNIYSGNSSGEAIICGSNDYLYLNSLAVNCFDE